MSDSCLTPKPVRRALFPSSHERRLNTLGEPLMNSPRRSPRIASRSSDKTPRDKENRSPVSHNNLDDLFGSANFPFEVPTSPTPRRRRLHAGTAQDKRLSLPFCSPTTRKERDPVSQTSPARLTSEKLQRAQEHNPEATPSRHKHAKTSEPNIPALPSLGDSSPRSITNEVIDNIVMDIFGDETSVAQMESFYPFEPPKSPPSGNWADWVPSDYVSPARSENNTGRTEMGSSRPNLFGSPLHDNSEDLITAILSDPDIQNTTLCDSRFGSVIFEDSTAA
jgi:hypothetical protein